MNETKPTGLRLPVQTAVDRTPGYGALADTPGVDAQINWGHIGHNVLHALHDITPGISTIF